MTVQHQQHEQKKHASLNDQLSYRYRKQVSWFPFIFSLIDGLEAESVWMTGMDALTDAQTKASKH